MTPATPPATPPARRLDAQCVWIVLARQHYDAPLHEVGTIMADEPELARVYARSIYDECNWIEMVLVPRASIIPVIDA